MQKIARPLFLLSLWLPLATGCESKRSNRVIEGTGNEITPEMIEVEETELKTTQ